MRKIDEIYLLKEVGIPDPINFYNQLEKTRTMSHNNESYTPNNRTRSKKSNYNELLGF